MGTDPRLALLLLITLLGCAHRAPLTWQAPARAIAAPVSWLAPEDPLHAAFQEGLSLDPEQAAALFPTIGLDPELVRRVVLSAEQVARAGSDVALLAPTLRFYDRRWGMLEVGVCTRVLVQPASALALYRQDVQVEPPEGAWIATDRTTLRRVGALVVGQERQRAPDSKP